MNVVALIVVWTLVGASAWLIRRRLAQGVRPGERRTLASRHRSGAPKRAELRSRLAAIGDAGAVVVEAAIITPIFVIIVVAIVEFGSAYKDQLGVESSVRAGARLASSEPRTSTFAADAVSAVAHEGSALTLSNVQTLWVYQANAAGYPANGAPAGTGTSWACLSNCVQYAYSGGNFVLTSGSWDFTTQNACVGTEDSLGVYMTYRHSGVTQIFFSALTLSSHTVMRLEPIPATQTGGCR